MVRLFREGQSLREVATKLGVSPATVQLWVKRASDTPLERVDWEDKSHAPLQHPNQSEPALQQQVLALRKQLKQSDLGEYGAVAIREALLAQGVSDAPSLATIHRILRREGEYEKAKRIRRAPPRKGWYLPQVARRDAEIDESDFVEALFLEGSPEEYFALNTVSLHGGLCATWLTTTARTDFVLECLLSHWRVFGLPDYAQFDNGKVFSGPHLEAHCLGRTIRFCLSLGVVPVFAVPCEFGIQSAIESYNNRWQQKVWQRFSFSSLEEAQSASARYLAAARAKVRLRCEQAPLRRPFPNNWQLPKGVPKKGTVILLRRTNGSSQLNVWGRLWQLPEPWIHRLVRCEIQLDTQTLRVYGLRRATPDKQPLLAEWNYTLDVAEEPENP